MKRIILGIIIGVVLSFIFFYFGGSDYLIEVGKKTEKVGSELKEYERKLKDSAENLKDMAEKAKEKVKQYIP
jgi:uncharacterized membrane-anchored protein YhcB (DUF1043 family)